MSSPESDYQTQQDSRPPYSTPPALIAFTLAVLILCFVAFSIVYLCRYCFVRVIHTWAFQRAASGSLIRLSPNSSPPRGLDSSTLQIFPTFLYASVKDLRKEKCSLECAICLLEFEDDSMLRLLTVCCHVFHQECIDLWLRSHKTCPVCRRDLDSPTNETQKPGDIHCAEESGVSSTSDDVRIDIREGESVEHKHEHDGDYPFSVSMSQQQQQDEQRFARSHSTGHSLVLIRAVGDEENDNDKYTLRLPEHVITRHNCSRSCASSREITRPVAPCSNCGFLQPVSGFSTPSHTQKS